MDGDNERALYTAILDLWGVQEILGVLEAQGLEDSAALRVIGSKVGEVAVTIEGVRNALGGGVVSGSMPANCE